ncbi:hypothetical protein V8B55DRAFT_1583290 [Mucor lusitanicus]|uniref:Uncharacterized protein n=1 Tax=Mucor lusitanicus CBS 277.49 TaxID=747725 RepID=A0A168JUP7_MUCCL|nr:hypothetical protein MUCCIDRAFT_113109 [Mucor lusitanicus CBS 277.49]
MQNNNNKEIIDTDELVIKQYTPPKSTEMVQVPQESSLAVVEGNKPSVPRGTFRNKASKILALLNLYKDIYPPRVPFKERSRAWQRIVDGVNSQFPNDVPVHVDVCRKEVQRNVANYASTFSEASVNLNSGSNRRSKELEQVVYNIWIKQREDGEADRATKLLLRESHERKLRCQEKLKRSVAENKERRNKRQKQPSGFDRKGKQVLVGVEVEEPLGEPCGVQRETASSQQTNYTLDNPYYSSEASCSYGGASGRSPSLARSTVKPEVFLKEEFMDQQKRFQDESIKLQKESIQLQKDILSTLQQLMEKINKE